MTDIQTHADAANELIQIRLSEQAQPLFQAYQQFTGVTPESYIEALVDKTLPTLQALVEALQEAGEDSEAVMELFGRKMAESMLAQQEQQAGQQPQ